MTDRAVVVAGRSDVCDGTLGLGRQQHLVFDERVLVYYGVQVASGDVGPHLMSGDN